MSMTPEQAAREIETHLQILVDYDVIEAQVSETLTEYIWVIINQIDLIKEPDQLEDIWKRGTDGNLCDN